MQFLQYWGNVRGEYGGGGGGGGLDCFVSDVKIFDDIVSI